MSKVYWYLSDDDEQDERKFWYHRNLDSLKACPAGCDAALNATTVGWRRCRLTSGVIVETIRLPEGYRWLELGMARVSPDGRNLVRDVTDPDSIEGHTLFDSTGYLHDYFIFRGGRKRLVRETR